MPGDPSRAHLDRPTPDAGAVTSRLRPALLARYLDLTTLRHDYPIVLVPDEDEPVRTLTTIVNELLADVAPSGAAGERTRQHVLRLEAAVRRVLDHRSGSLTFTEAWERATTDLLQSATDEERESLRDSLTTARAGLHADGALIRFEDAVPAVVRHLRDTVERPRRIRSSERIEELIRRLREALDADQLRSPDGRDPVRLRASVGTTHESDFDFDAWSEVLASRPHDGALSASRRARIEWALRVLRDRSLPRADVPDELHEFEFDSCTRALAAFHARVAEVVQLVKAIAIAELELDNAYDDATHDPFFHAFDLTQLRDEDLQVLPGHLIVIDGDELDPPTRAEVLDLLASSLPFKILVVSTDAVGPPPLHDPLSPHRLDSVELTGSALGLGTAPVVQLTADALARTSSAVREALASRGPALINIVTASVQAGGGLAPYVAAAAAAEARAVPLLSYDPRPGADGGRLTLAGPQPSVDWPTHRLEYADEDLQLIREDVAFTFADLVATDPRFSAHVAITPRRSWSGTMVPVDTFIRMADAEREGARPYVLVVGEDDVLRRVTVDHHIVAAAERRLAAWHRLQARAGVHEPEVDRDPDPDRAGQQDEPATAVSQIRPTGGSEDPEPAATVTTDSPPGEVPVPTDDAPEPGEAWIETARCTTCDECTNLNPRMFAYDENKQAYLADLHAGTFRELVQAAEECQVAIIHPGEPWDPDEPGLAALRQRAAAFA